MKKVTIIIPVYNAEKYIDKCLMSIIKQTYKSIEIILINDGSSDSTLSIISNYQNKYDNIFVYNQRNQGQAIARNNGIKHSNGYYLTFVDNDDTIDKNYIKSLVKSIENNEILISGYNRVDENDNILYTKKPLICEWSIFKYCSTWGKLYNTKFVKKNNLQFGNYKIGEDIYFILNACSKTPKIKIFNYSGYNNLRNLTSVSNVIYTKGSKKVDELMPLLIQIDKNINFSRFDKNNVTYFYLKTIVLYLYNQRKVLNMKNYYKEYKIYFNWLKNIYDKYDCKMAVRKQEGEELKINLIISLFLIFGKINLIYLLLFSFKIFTKENIK